MHPFPHRHSGFTLIELSIVLVIIGLIVGGILVGRDLIKAAELRQVIGTVEKLNTAVSAFRTKYDCLPGDCATATNFFPQRAFCDPGTNVLVIEAPTCNGNGDGAIGGGAVANDPVQAESFLFWQHLSDAGLTAGLFTGKIGMSYQDAIANQNVPALHFRAGMVDVFYFSDYQETMQDFMFASPVSNAFLGKHLIQLGVNYGNGASRGADLLFSSNEAHNLDIKMDDGSGQTGNVRATTRTICQDANGNYLASDAVSGMQTSTAAGCSLYIGASF